MNECVIKIDRNFMLNILSIILFFGGCCFGFLFIWLAITALNQFTFLPVFLSLVSAIVALILLLIAISIQNKTFVEPEFNSSIEEIRHAYMPPKVGKVYTRAEVELVSLNLKSADDWLGILNNMFDIILDIKDKKFMQNVLEGKESFKCNDILICDLLFIGSRYNKNIFEAKNIHRKKI